MDRRTKMSTPILILVGQAGSGKDTVADFLVKDYGAIKLSLADPMKRFAQKIFLFSNDQLWGPSESRNAIHEPSLQNSTAFWQESYDRFLNHRHDFLDEMNLDGPKRNKLTDWFYLVRRLAVPKTFINEVVGLSPRVALQTLGTEFGRAVDKNLWIRFALRAAADLLEGGYGYYRERGIFDFEGILPPSMVIISDGRFRNELLEVKRVGGMTVKIQNVEVESRPEVGVKGHASEQEQKGIPETWFDFVIRNDKTRGLGQLGISVAVLAGSQNPKVIGPYIPNDFHVGPGVKATGNVLLGEPAPGGFFVGNAGK